MKQNVFLAIGAILVGIIVIGAVVFSMRQFSLAITTVDVIEVEPGVRCARMVTADGAAISCWVADNE